MLDKYSSVKFNDITYAMSVCFGPINDYIIKF